MLIKLGVNFLFCKILDSSSLPSIPPTLHLSSALRNPLLLGSFVSLTLYVVDLVAPLPHLMHVVL